MAFLIQAQTESNIPITDFDLNYYGLNGVSSLDLMNWYTNEYSEWNLLESKQAQTDLYYTYGKGWQSGIYISLVITIDGQLVKSLTDYDTVAIVSTFPIWSYFL